MLTNRERSVTAVVWVITGFLLLATFLVLMLAGIRADEVPSYPGFTDEDAVLWKMIPATLIVLSLISVGLSAHVTRKAGRP